MTLSPRFKKCDKNKSFYVGDALGRQGDWSDVDKQFAENIELKYWPSFCSFHVIQSIKYNNKIM